LIRSRLKDIIDSRGISIRQVARDTDSHFETIRRIYNDDMQQYPRDVIDRLCTYLDVGVGELLEHAKST
jgi:DNA-binding Xre family transcriptional regulator